MVCCCISLYISPYSHPVLYTQAPSPPFYVSNNNAERRIEMLEDLLSHANLTLDAWMNRIHQEMNSEEIDNQFPQLLFDTRMKEKKPHNEEEVSELINLYSEEKLKRSSDFDSRRKMLQKLFE
jgi:hypothetical protein